MKLMASILQISLLCGSIEAAWIERKAEGWAWYEENKQEMKKVMDQEKPKLASEQIAEAKKKLEEKLAEAMIHPSEENVKDYIVEQKKWLHQSTVFANIWSKVLLQNPELDPTIKSPVTQYGVQLKKNIDSEENELFIRQLSKENGLFFFYEGNSRVSQAVSKIVSNFSEKYNWEVLAISMDGVFFKEFPSSKIDNGISSQMGISIFPALFVVNPNDQTATPVAYGLVSLDQIEEKVILQFKKDENPHE